MIEEKTLRALEFDKIREKIAEYCVLYGGKEEAVSIQPETEYEQAKFLLDKTSEAFDLLYNKGVSGVEFYDEVEDSLKIAEKGATLSMGELLKVCRLLKSARLLYSSVSEKSETAPILSSLAQGLYADLYLENEIREKILSEDTMSDNASEKLCSLRKLIKKINEQIREKLNSYIHGQYNKYLQENIITMRGDRYVLPVKSEYRGQINGFIHDQSSTGSTVFIEPAAILELNNSLRSALAEEQSEIERILSELSQKVGVIAEKLGTDEKILRDFDLTFAKATYAYKTKAIKPKLNGNGKVNIVGGKHPLLKQENAVPVSLKFGEDYRFLLVTGPNTGGKTVTLKMTGLFCLMAMSGMFIQASDGSEVCVYKTIFCDIGDKQSIEQSLSTFSSHIKNIIHITEYVDGKSLVLIDEIGAGTDPDEGSAIARAVIEYLLEKNCFGIITTHYSALKEFAYLTSGIKNASMEFDAKTFKPFYRINIGMPGSSNAIEISKMLGLDIALTDRAYSLLSNGKTSFENVIREAENARHDAVELQEEINRIKAEEEQKLKEIDAEKKRLEAEKEKFYTKAKADARRIVNERLEEADEIIQEIKILFDKEELTSGDLIKARTLRDKLEGKKYNEEETDVSITNYSEFDILKAKVGDKVYYKPMGVTCEIAALNQKKKEVELFIGSIKTTVKPSDLSFVSTQKEKNKTSVALKRGTNSSPLMEINVIGMTAGEAIVDVDRFIDQAVISNLEEVKIIHGKGLKILSKTIHEHLKRDKRVISYRFGNYGEGEHGVTFVKLR